MWFKFRDSKVKFSIVKFTLITRLKCVEEVDASYVVDTSDASNRLKDLYFSSFSDSIERSNVEHMFRNQILFIYFLLLLFFWMRML